MTLINPNLADYTISTDKDRLDVTLIHEFLSNSYWSPGIPRLIVETGIANALCFGAYHGTQQVGFARVISDYATFAYLADVFIVPEHRGKGLSKALMAQIMAHPSLQGLRRFMLGTRDAHGLYAQFGFTPLANPPRMMEILRPNIYTSAV